MSEPLAVREVPARYQAVLESPRVRPGYKQTEVGVIPEDWEYLPIADSIDLLTGFPFPSSGYSNSGIRLLRGSNVKRGVTDWSEDGTEYWSSITTDIRKYVLKNGDIVIAMDGSLVGRSFAMLSDKDVPSLLLQRVARVRSNVIAQKYLKAWICSQRFTEHCDSVKTMSAIPHISPADIRSFKIVLPPTQAEQEAIAETLSDADALIEALEQLIAKKRHLKQGAMQELLTGKKRLPGFRGEWEETTLGKLGKCHRGVSYNPNLDLSPFDTERTVRLLRSNNVQEARVVFTDVQYVGSRRVSDDQRLRTNDILICMANGSRDLVGKAGRFTAEDGFEYTFGAFMGCFRSYEQTANPDFVYYLFQTDKYRAHIAMLLAGSSINNLKSSSVEALLIGIPSDMEEQTTIATILSDMDTEIAALETRLAKTRALKQGMMQELLTGKIRLV